MEDHDPNSPRQGSEKSEPVRSRWTPKPEQILILESIFNSGMVNPPKDETVRIRKLLEKFGTVGDANVFYWFQNRRSRSRRRQRQMQQQQQDTLPQRNHHNIIVQQHQPHPHHHQVVDNGAIPSAIAYDQTQTTPSAGAVNMGFVSSSSYNFPPGSSSSSCGGGGVVVQQGAMDGFFSVFPQMGYPGIDHTSAASSSSVLYPPLAPNLNYQSGYGGANASGFITVFINGIATELQGGPIDIKTVFGEDVMLVHSSGVPVPTNEFGFLMQSLQHGESYFLVSKPTQV